MQNCIIFRPKCDASCHLVHTCVESGNLEQALSLFAEMKKSQIHPNFVTYNTILRARSRYDSVRGVQQCLATYRDVQNAGYTNTYFGCHEQVHFANSAVISQYKSNDHYLKQLIEEWCEGFMHDSYANKENSM
ncbi:hypothetical protein ACFX1T_032557 [Malus domestica]